MSNRSIVEQGIRQFVHSSIPDEGVKIAKEIVTSRPSWFDTGVLRSPRIWDDNVPPGGHR
jgi:hypothetical protein